jgi:hypothetical protein
MQNKVEIVAKQLCLTELASKSLTKLCNRGCEPRKLGELLAQWKAWTTQPALEIKGRTIQLRPNDDWETALGRLRPEDIDGLDSKIQSVQGALKDLMDTLADLHEKRLVKLPMRWDPVHETLEVLEGYRLSVLPVILKASHQIGPRRSPDQARLTDNILRYVVKRTGRPWYSDIECILQGLHPDTRVNADSLKQRKYRGKR